MVSPLVFVLILAMTTFAAATNLIYASENPLPVGSKVTLFSQENITTGAWMFDNDLIVMMFPGNQIITDAWRGRTTFNSTTSSLTIRSLLLDDSGVYTLQEVNSFRSQLTLSVQVPISNVTLRANATNLVEFNDTAVLVCSVLNGSSLSYVWLKGSSVVVAGGARVLLSDGGATLTLVGVTRDDEGSFRCNVSNGVSHEISLPVHLNISYGPSNTTMTRVPMRPVYLTGSNITLSCWAESSPPATVQWMVDGVYLNRFGPQLRLENVTKSNSGDYRCLIHNAVTSRFSGKSATIKIVEPISAVAVNHTGGPVILDEPLVLRCEVTGYVTSIQWWRNGQLITADNTTGFDVNNKTLILSRVQLSDNGDYRCRAFNLYNNMTSSPYAVEVNYGPMKAVIAGPSTALAGTLETLNCSSASHPPSHIDWNHNGTLVATGPHLVMGPLTLNMSGKYVCVAYNNVTGKNSSAYTMLTVLAPVTMATIRIVGAQPIVNHTFTLTCETAGGAESIAWMHDRLPLHPDNTTSLSADNVTLTFDPVATSNNGNYSCVASNPLSYMSSEIFELEVFYGPLAAAVTGPSVAETGRNATFGCDASSNPPSSYRWFFNESQVASGPVYVTPPLTADMSGVYTCTAFNDVTGRNSTARAPLAVFDPIESVQVETPVHPAVEGHYYNLTCVVNGPARQVYWMKNGEPLHEDNRTAFHMDNRTVTINPLEHNDTGRYRCMAVNAVENMTSAPYLLLVNFGPETPVIDGPAFAETGQRAVFRCSATSTPPSRFSWWFNGSNVANSSVFTTDHVSLNMSGEYTCVAHNNVTGRSSSDSKTLTVVEATESVTIRNNTVPINSENFTLVCDVSGSYDAIYWTKDDTRLNVTHAASPNASRRVENETLRFTPVTLGDDGTYRCVATNHTGPHRSPEYVLLVNYGPLSVTISGPNSTALGRLVSLTCSADSRPDCDFRWSFNNQSSPALNTGPVHTFLATEANEGNYVCTARNPVTNITMRQTKAFTVAAHAAALHLPTQGGLLLMGLLFVSSVVSN